MINHILKIMQKFQVDVNDAVELYKTVWKTGMLKKNVPNIRKTKKVVLPESPMMCLKQMILFLMIHLTCFH